MMENRARICTAIALVLVVSVLAQAHSAPAGGEDGQGAERPASGRCPGSGGHAGGSGAG